MKPEKRPRVLVLSGDNSPYRQMLENSLSETYDISFKSVLVEITSFINAYKPDILIHDWSAIDESQGRIFHQKYAKSSASRNIFRLIVAKKVTPDMLAFATDTYVDKVIDVSTAKLNLDMHIEMLMNSSGHKEILNISQISQTKNGRYSQDDIDKKIDRIYKKFPHDEDVQLEMANLNLRREDLAEAKKLANKVLKKNALNLRAVNLLSRVFMKENKWKEADQLLRKANSLSPKNSDRLLLLGDCCFGMGKLDEAIGFYSEAMLANSDNKAKAEKSMGKAMISKGDLEAALNLIQKSASEEEAAGYFNNAAVIAVREKGNYKEAIKLYEMALQSLKTDKLKPMIYYNLALSHKKYGNLLEAAKLFKRALKYKPDYPKAKRHLRQIEMTSVDNIRKR
jgi:tetratricopeptide (TPR) repeat protein